MSAERELTREQIEERGATIAAAMAVTSEVVGEAWRDPNAKLQILAGIRIGAMAAIDCIRQP